MTLLWHRLFLVQTPKGGGGELDFGGGGGVMKLTHQQRVKLLRLCRDLQHRKEAVRGGALYIGRWIPAMTRWTTGFPPAERNVTPEWGCGLVRPHSGLRATSTTHTDRCRALRRARKESPTRDRHRHCDQSGTTPRRKV